MPRAAIIAWNSQTGQVEILASKDGKQTVLTLDPEGAESWAKLVRHLKALAPILPPGQPSWGLEEIPDPLPTPETTRHVYRQPMPAKGSGQTLRVASNEDLLDLLLDDKVKVPNS